MLDFFKKKKAEKFSLIIDIQSGLVRGAVIKKVDGENPKILRITTKNITRKVHTNIHYINKMMQKALSEVIKLLTENHRIDSIDVILSSPWVLSNSKTIKIDFPEMTEIKEETITNIIDSEKNKLENKFKDDNKSTNIENDLNYIEQKIFNIRLNGYSVNQYIGKKAKDIEISFAMTLSSTTILNKISEIIEKTIHIKKIQYHSGLLLNYIALRRIIPEQNDYIYLHIHGELTDVIIVKNGLCANIASFPLGIMNLIRRISHIFKQNDEVSDSMLSLYQGGRLNDIETNKIKEIIEEFSNSWYAVYNKILTLFSETNVAPRFICFYTQFHSDIFKQILINKNSDDIHIVDYNIEKIESEITFEKTSEYNQLIKMYALALNDMIQ